MPTVNLDTAARLDIICRKGDSFELVVQFDSNAGLYGSTILEGLYSMDIRETDDASALALPSGNAMSIAVDDSTQKMTISNTGDNMDEIDAGLYVYDVQYASAGATGTITTYLTGTFEVREDVTDNA